MDNIIYKIHISHYLCICLFPDAQYSVTKLSLSRHHKAGLKGLLLTTNHITLHDDDEVWADDECYHYHYGHYGCSGVRYGQMNAVRCSAS